MIGLIKLLAINSVLQVIVTGKLFKIGDDVQTCTKYCFTNGSTGNFKDGNCVCENLDNTNAENAIPENREAKYIDFDSNELTNEDRIIRCILKSRKHMRHDDGDRIVRYFINDGPANGHAYFIQAANQGTDLDMEKECKSDNNSPTNSFLNLDEFNDQNSDEQPSIANRQLKQNYGNAIVGAPYNQYNPIYLLSNEVPIAPVVTSPYRYVMASPYNTVIEPKSNMLSYRTFPHNNLVGAKLLPRSRLRTNIVKRISDALYGKVRKNVKNEIKQVNSIVGSPNEDDNIPTVNSENIQRTSASPVNFQSIPYNQQYLTSIYPSQYLVGSPISGLYNTMPKTYILQPVNMMLQGIDSMEQSKIISSSQSQESVNYENNNSMNTDESASTS